MYDVSAYSILVAVKAYEERVEDTSRSLVAAMKARSGQVIDISEWFIWFTFDTMGAVAFGKSLGTVDKGEEHFAHRILTGGRLLYATLGTIPWAFRILASLPGSPVLRFRTWCAELVEEQRKVR